MLIHLEHIKPDTVSNFDKCSSEACTVQDLPYDFGSVMHYSPFSFTNSTQPTITMLNGSTAFGQRNGFSDLDVQGINKFYCGEFTLCGIINDYIPLFVARPILKRLLTLIGAITACCDTIEVHTGFSNIDGTYNKELTLSGGRAYYSFIHLQHGTAYLYWYIPTASWLVSTVYIYKIIRIMYMVGW